MTLNEFNLLDDLNAKMEAVNQFGTFIDNHITKIERCNCYAINRFFVEVVYNAENNTIVKINSFKTGYLLDKYSNIKLI
tara:strand:- start:1718 stop:1954 length:237 start_codon:yes stop_codon:yes gene_type:complete